MKPYNEWLEIARRFDKVVDFGSPMTAWSDAMWAEYKRKNPPRCLGATEEQQHELEEDGR